MVDQYGIDLDKLANATPCASPYTRDFVYSLTSQPSAQCYAMWEYLLSKCDLEVGLGHKINILTAALGSTNRPTQITPIFEYLYRLPGWSPEEYRFALERAIDNDNITAVQWITDNNFAQLDQIPNIWEFIHTDARHSQYAMCKHLIDNGIALCKESWMLCRVVRAEFCFEEQKQILELYKEHGYQFNFEQSLGHDVMPLCSCELAQYLIEDMNVSVEAYTTGNITILADAVAHGLRRYELIEYLLKKGAKTERILDVKLELDTYSKYINNERLPQLAKWRDIPGGSSDRKQTDLLLDLIEPYCTKEVFEKLEIRIPYMCSWNVQCYFREVLQ